MMQYIALTVAILALIVAGYTLLQPRYQIASPVNGVVYRLDIRTGLITSYAQCGDELEEIAHTSK